MSKTLLFATALLALTATTSFAQRGSLTLGWNNCRVSGGGVVNASFACDSNSGQGALLVGGFIPNASANLQSLNSAFLYVDVFPSFGLGDLPQWWQFTDPPVTGCRPLSIWGLDLANAAGATCNRSYWSEVGQPVSAARWFFPTYMVNHGALRILVAVDAQVAAQTPQIAAGEESHIFGARLGHQNSTGAGSCSGCTAKVSLYFAEADFNQTNLDNFVVGHVGDFPNTEPKCATWQNPAFQSCLTETPVRNGTWGSIKSLYR